MTVYLYILDKERKIFFNTIFLVLLILLICSYLSPFEMWFAIDYVTALKVILNT